MTNNKLTILFIDDEDLILEVGEKLLNFLGHNCLKVKNSKDALEIYKRAMETENKIDAIIIDILSNDTINTEELIVKLKEINPDVKAIISSGYLNHKLMLNYKEYGFSSFIRKPYGLKELQNVLETLQK
jgi:DNA-binding NtrC family response regulator